MDDLDTRVDAILARHEADKAKRKKADDPHSMGKSISAVFARVERQQDLDRGAVEIKAYEC